jgi:hypothetical protein
MVAVLTMALMGFAASTAQAAPTTYWDGNSAQFGFESDPVGTEVVSSSPSFPLWGLDYGAPPTTADVRTRLGTLESQEPNAGTQCVEFNANGGAGGFQREVFIPGGISTTDSPAVRMSWLLHLNADLTTGHVMEMSIAGDTDTGGVVSRVTRLFLAGQGDGTMDLYDHPSRRLITGVDTSKWYEIRIEIDDFDGVDGDRYDLSVYDTSAGGTLITQYLQINLGINNPTVVAKLTKLVIIPDPQVNGVQLDFFRLSSSTDGVSDLGTFVPVGSIPDLDLGTVVMIR